MLADPDPISSAYDSQHELVYTGTFDLAGFFAVSPASANDTGWKMVKKLQQELPDNRPWSAYRVLNGQLSITSRRRQDVEANLARLNVLVNLEALGFSI